MGEENQDINEKLLVENRTVKTKTDLKVKRVFTFPDTTKLTGSTNLIKRDTNTIREVYNMFGINVSHNCSEGIETRNDAAGNQIYKYGQLSNVQLVYLLNELFKTKERDRIFNHIMSENRLMQGWRIAGKDVARRITIKSIKGVICDLPYNAGVDTLAEDYLQALCEGIASFILSDIERDIEEHNISTNIEKLYKVFGSKKAERIIDNLTKNVFAKQCYFEDFLDKTKKIAIIVTHEITQDVKNRSKASNKLELLMYAISKIVAWSEHLVQISNLRQMIDKLLRDLGNEISRLDEVKEELEENIQVVVEMDCDSFTEGVIDQWKSLLLGKVWQIIFQHFFSPVFEEEAYYLVENIVQKLEEVYQSYKESGYLKRFEDLKREHQEKLRSIKRHDEDTSITEYLITEKYHKKLQKLMTKTRNPDLLAEIVRENTPMDMVCVDASTQIVPDILKQQGVVISGLTITVEGDYGMRQSFSSISEGSDEVNIPLELRKNHFELRGSTAENNGGREIKNDCLYEALSKAIPELENVTPEGFRVRVADYIRIDEGIRYHIQQGWHQLPISRGVFGGKPYKFAFKPSKLQKEAENHSPFQHSSPRGVWKFDEFVDVDLREHKKLTNRDAHIQRAEAFTAALRKINERLTLINVKHTTIDSAIFTPTKFDTILCSTGYGKIGVGLYPVEMEAAVNVQAPGEQFKYKLRIDVDNPEAIESDLQGPHGPHVGYEVIRPNKRAPEGVTGHILINRMENTNLPDRGRSKYVLDKDSRSVIPLSRVFSLPIKTNTSLERVGTRDVSEIDRRKVRGRSFPSPNF